MDPGGRARLGGAKRKAAICLGTMRFAHLRRISENLGERLAPFVAAAGANVSIDDLRGLGRREARVAAARQLGMYLAHTLFSSSYSRTGRVFGRDRTTVRHACVSIEERREDGATRALLAHLEPAMQGWSETFAEQAARTEAGS